MRAPEPSGAEAGRRASGVAFAIAAYFSWGLVALYWKRLQRVAPTEIVAHRVVWSFVFVGVLALFISGRGAMARAFRDGRTLGLLLGSAALIAFNWGLFIWAVNNGHLADVSLGYFINPLVSVGLGTLVLGESLRRLQKGAVVLASLGVLVLVAGGAGFPWIGLCLAGSFGAYGLLRKIARVEALVGFFIETCFLGPAAIAFLFYRVTARESVFVTGTTTECVLSIGSGVITALPLVWFAAAARRLPLSTVGLIQYIAPTLQLSLAVGLFGEHVEPMKWAAFGLIWVALGIFTFDMLSGQSRSPVDTRPPRVTDPIE